MNRRRPTGRRGALLCVLLPGALWLAGCAAPAPATPALAADAPSWSGRLALRVESDPPQSLAAAFELKGSARAGELSLATPLGSTLAQLSWAPGNATLKSAQETRQFDSVDALLAQVTGTSVPVGALFDWLAGTPTAVDGWQADLSQHASGRVLARRTQPLPAADLRLVLDRP